MSITTYGFAGNRTILTMPGSEIHIKSEGALIGKQVAIIKSGTPHDMVALCIWADAVHRDGGFPYLIIPYLPGARQDRRAEGEALSCKVYADIINSCKLEAVYCIDPHSDVMPALINNCKVIPFKKIIELAKPTLQQFIGELAYVGIIAPDAGAAKRAAIFAGEMNLPLYQALKKRDPKTGKLSSFSCEQLPPEGKFLVVDDICDGGGTFKGLAQVTKLQKERLALWVTHGVFSKGVLELQDYYSKIYTTDSHDYNIDYQYEHKFLKILSRVEIIPYLKDLI